MWLTALSFHANKGFHRTGHTKTFTHIPWWCHQMETFSALLAPIQGNPPVTGGFPSQWPVTWSFDFFYLHPNKQLGKQSSRRWFETPSRSLWSHSNVLSETVILFTSRPHGACVHWRIGSSLAQVIAWHLRGFKSSIEIMMTYHELDAQEQTSLTFEFKWKFFKQNTFETSENVENLVQVSKFHQQFNWQYLT